jgi:pyruvate/2-oxoacid:ferredoxin oxidoreductase alpha subunit
MTSITTPAAPAASAAPAAAGTGAAPRSAARSASPPAQLLIKGNEAAVRGAILAGCRAFYGYPITPASEIAQTAALLLPAAGGTFLQAESEVAAINMVYGAAAAGVRAMTASSSPGISLKQEGLSYAAGAELPLVVIDIMRGGPGLGNIGPEQADYFQMVKGGGHGNYRLIVLAPDSAQEMCDFTLLAFELADHYRNPACVLADGVIGQMMEPVRFPEPRLRAGEPDWAVRGDRASMGNLISSIYLEHAELEAHNRRLKAKYDQIERDEPRSEIYRGEDAEILVVAYGIVARIAHSVIDLARARGIRAGLFRPQTLWPFPSAALAAQAERARAILVVELSMGQMVEDVRLAIRDRRPVRFHGRTGGMLPAADDLLAEIEAAAAAARS